MRMNSFHLDDSTCFIYYHEAVNGQRCAYDIWENNAQTYMNLLWIFMVPLRVTPYVFGNGLTFPLLPPSGHNVNTVHRISETTLHLDDESKGTHEV